MYIIADVCLYAANADSGGGPSRAPAACGSPAPSPRGPPAV